jgi:hypothetical protein
LIGGVEDSEKILWIPDLLFEILTFELLNRKQKCSPFFFSDCDINWRISLTGGVEDSHRTLCISGLPFEIRTMKLLDRKQKCSPFFFSDHDA